MCGRWSQLWKVSGTMLELNASLDDNASHSFRPAHFLLPHPFLAYFHERYSSIHCYTSLAVCVPGVVSNAIIICILTRKDMRSPTNLLLSWLAVSDALTMIPYIPFAANFYCPPVTPFEAPERFSLGWVTFLLMMMNSTNVTHTISVWLGVSLAAFRLIHIRFPARGHVAKEKRFRQVQVVIVLVIIGCVVLLIPNFSTTRVELMDTIGNITVYRIGGSTGDPYDETFASDDSNNASGGDASKGLLSLKDTVLHYSIVTKLLPCGLMLAATCLLFYHVTIVGLKRRRRLMASSAGPQSLSMSRRASQQARTTWLLVTVLLLFLITELPQGVLLVMSVSVSGFYQTVYYPLSDLIDFLALINNGINFLLYCTMSHQFRSKVAEFLPCKRAALSSGAERRVVTSSV